MSQILLGRVCVRVRCSAENGREHAPNAPHRKLLLVLLDVDFADGGMRIPALVIVPCARRITIQMDARLYGIYTGNEIRLGWTPVSVGHSVFGLIARPCSFQSPDERRVASWVDPLSGCPQCHARCLC